MDYKNIVNKIGVVSINMINLLIILITLIIANKNFGFSNIEAVKVIIFMIGGVYLPGKFICRKIKMNLDSKYSNSILYFFIGIAVLFIQYYIFGIIGIPNLIFIVTIIISSVEVLYIVFVDKERINIKGIFNIKNSLLFSLITITFVYSMIKLQFTYPRSEILSKISGYTDMVWHFGNVNTLAGSFPPMDPRVSGIEFKYHYFVDLLYAICMRFTGVLPEAQSISIAPIMISYITVGSLYALSREFIKGKYTQILFIAIAIFSNVFSGLYLTGEEGIEAVYGYHIFTNVNSVAYALASSIIFSVIVIRFIKNMDYSKGTILRFSICGSMLIFVCTGFKGPFGAVMVGGLIVILLISLISRYKYSKEITIFTSVVTIIFATLYILLLSNPAGGGGLKLTIYDTVGSSIFADSINNSSLIKKTLYSLLAMPAEFIILLGGFSIPFLIFVIEYVIGLLKRDKLNIDSDDIITIFLLSASILGCGGFFLLSQSGLSQMYFIFTIIPFIQIIWFKWSIDKLSKRKNLIYKAIILISCLYIMKGLINNGIYVVESLKNAVYNREVNISEEVNPGGDYITKNEYEAMVWMRENTPKDSIFISDRQSAINGKADGYFLNNRFFYFTAYSARRAFLEGYSYSSISEEMLDYKLDVVNKMYNNDYTYKYNLAKENEIDYIVVSKFVNPDFKINDDRIEKCYYNDDISIYKIN